MGMSSSQARLLTLTARMHDIEYKAQRIEAQKLQLANDSRRAYEDYLVALDAKKVQYRSINSDGSVTFIDANLARLENGAVPGYTGLKSNKSFLIKNADTNEVYVTREFANAYGITGGEAPSAGDLDDYLESHGAHKREITRTETDYSDVQSVTPVNNKIIAEPTTQTVNDPDSYSISGTLPSPVDTSVMGTTSYSVSGTTPSVSSVAGVPTPLTKTVVTSGTDATGDTENVNVGATTSELTKFEYVIPKQTFNVNPTLTYSFDTSDLNLTMQQLSDKYGWNWDFSDTVSTGGHDLNNLNTKVKSNGTSVNSLYGIETTDIVNDNFKYTSTTTLNQLLTHLGSLSGITYNASAGTLTGTNFTFDSDDDNNGTWGTNELENYLRKNVSYTGGTTKTFTSATLMADFVSSDQFSGTARYGDFRIFKPDGITRIECTYKYYPTYNYSGSSSAPPANFTYADYLNYIANEPEMKANNFTWWEDAEGIHTTIENGYKIAQMTYSTMPGKLNNETTNTTDTTITINRNAIAEDIYLARSIIAAGGVTPEEYSANHNAQITSILSEMSSAYGNYATDENKRQLVLFNEALTDALTSGDTTKITNALALLGTTIASDKYVAVNSSTSTPTTSGNITSSNTIVTKNNITYIFNDSNVSITPSTTEIPDGSQDNPGTLTVNGSNNELEKYLAYKCYQNNNSKTYEQYLTRLQGRYNTYQLAELVENVSSYISQLVAGTDVSSSLTKYNSTSYNLSQTASGYNVTNTSTSTVYSVTGPNPDDVLDRLAFDIYTYNGSTGNPLTVKASIGGTFNNKELASLSNYYGTSAWNTIISSLASGISKSAVNSYIHDYDSYTVSNRSSNDVTINTVHNSHEVDVKGKMNIPTIQGIASNLVVAFRKAGYTVSEADVTSKLTSLYGTDDQTNNEKLANINNEAYKYLSGAGSSSIANIYNNLFGGASLSVPSTYLASKYEITRANLGTCQATYGTMEVPTGKWEWVHDELYEQLVQEWNVLKQLEGNIFVIVDEPLASSYEFVRNLLCETGAYLLEFNPELSNMKETNVATEVAVREVADETELKKAEAKYEADMRLIDRKDRKYDTELAAVETERNATKQEMETLKTVIKDNGERTFKLFS